MGTPHYHMAMLKSATSLQRAKAHQQAERAKVTAATGIRFEGDQLVVPSNPRRIVLIPCPASGCLYVAGGPDEAAAVEKIESHLSRVHGVQAPREVA